MTLLDTLRADLAELEAASLKRSHRVVSTPCAPHVVVDGRELLAFCSNDYLGLASHPAIAQALKDGVTRYGTGSGAAPLVSGHYEAHEQLEARLAAFTGQQRALLFSTGFMANTGVLPALVGRGDAIFADRLNHASLIDGALLSRAEFVRYPHLDLGALESALQRTKARRRVIVTDSVFSMDGDIAPLAELLALAERFDAWLVVDDAHGLGVLGPQGRGAIAEAGLDSWRIVLIGTLGKAAGVSGAFAAGHSDVVEWLLQKARTHLFTTGTPPALAEAVLASLDLIEHGDALRQQLNDNIALFRQELRATRWTLLPSRTSIQPVIIGSNDETLRVADALRADGIWVPAIRPPTVAAGSARLRVSLTAAHTAEDILRLTKRLNALEAAA